MSTINLNNTNLEFFEEGSGEPLILVHGSASDYRTWMQQFEDFSEHFRTIKYSRRYHWPNPQISDGEEYFMSEQVEDLETLLRSLEATPAHLVGHSYGAFLCLLLALRAPSLVRSMVLMEPPVLTLFVSNTPKATEILKLLVTRPRTAVAIIKFGAKGFSPAQKAFRRGDTETGLRLFGDAVMGSGGFKNLPESRKKQIYDNLSNVKAELLGPGFAPLEADRLRSIKIPALIMNGEESVGLFHRLSDSLVELLPNVVDRTFIPGASHNMHEDNAAVCNEEILSFLKAAH